MGVSALELGQGGLGSTGHSGVGILLGASEEEARWGLLSPACRRSGTVSAGRPMHR